MNTTTTWGTAILRGLYTAILSGLAAGVTAYATTDDEKGAILTGVIAALAALGFRGGIEGTFDSARQDASDVRPSDVQP